MQIQSLGVSVDNLSFRPAAHNLTEPLRFGTAVSVILAEGDQPGIQLMADDPETLLRLAAQLRDAAHAIEIAQLTARTNAGDTDAAYELGHHLAVRP